VASLPLAQPYDFPAALARAEVDFTRLPTATLQVNVTRLCNQACRHCHVDAGPKRTEDMDAATVDRCLELLEATPSLTTLDVTGGAPELATHFERLVRGARALNKHVMVRHNLTVTLDPHPRTGASMEHLPELFAELELEVVSSLPYYQEYFTDKQRGRGVFEKSITSMRRLNALGFGADGSGRDFTLVYNPVGWFLPPDQASLEADYKRELKAKFDVVFTRLIAITNMPINRFKGDLERAGRYDAYMGKLVGAFNPAAAAAVMCRSLISVDHAGRVYDCDFNQMLDLPSLGPDGAPRTVFDLDLDALRAAPIQVGPHCFGCTAGAGSSCGGATA
jgi:radical SAM/Cys-rich protein